MKGWVPHCIYLSLLVGGGLYFWSALRQEEAQLAFLLRPTDEAYQVMAQCNHEVQEDVERAVRAYVNPESQNAARRMQLADSCIRAALAGEISASDLHKDLLAFTPNDPELLPWLKKSFPKHPPVGTSADALRLLRQCDSLHGFAIRTQTRSIICSKTCN